MKVPFLKIIDFADGLRMVDVSGARDELAAGAVKFKDLLDRLGARYYTREGEHWRPTSIISWLGFMVDTNEGVARIKDKKVAEGTSLRQEIFGLQPYWTTSARALLSSAPRLNFV